MKNIPNLEPLFNEVVAYVAENQGDKGYIDCQPSLKGDIIYGFIFSDFSGVNEEKYVYGVRVVNGDLEALFEDITRTYLTEYSDEDFKQADDWVSVRWSDVAYIPTLFNIAENIEEYGK